KKHLIGMYDAELRFTDEHLGRLFAQIDRLGQPTLTVMHNDHGEEFFEHGAFEHNHALYDEVTRALLMFRSNAGQTTTGRIEAPATLADIAPTLYELLGIEPAKWPTLDGRSLVPHLLPQGDPPDWSTRPIGIGHLRYGLEKWGVVLNGQKYIFETASGREQLFDLAKDPEETKDLARTTGLEAWRQAASAEHEAKLARGWRIDVAMTSAGPRAPFVLELPMPAQAALVVDPEAEIPNPANQAWGQPPKRTTAQIGQVELSDDKTRVTFTPSSERVVRGQLAIVFGRDVDPAAVVMKRGGKPLTVLTSKGRASWKTPKDSLVLKASTVIAPPPSEAARIRAIEGRTEAVGADREMLRELGYLE
ncbi:MAG: sulfatase-like hydrolase/transferase, partial [Myxococcota bacterium]